LSDVQNDQEPVTLEVHDVITSQTATEVTTEREEDDGAEDGS
jgi:hypothetical protein